MVTMVIADIPHLSWMYWWCILYYVHRFECASPLSFSFITHTAHTGHTPHSKYPTSLPPQHTAARCNRTTNTSKPIANKDIAKDCIMSREGGRGGAKAERASGHSSFNSIIAPDQRHTDLEQAKSTPDTQREGSIKMKQRPKASKVRQQVPHREHYIHPCHSNTCY